MRTTTRGPYPAQDRLYSCGQIMLYKGERVRVLKVQPDYHWDYEVEFVSTNMKVRVWAQESDLEPWKHPLVQLAEQAE